MNRNHPAPPRKKVINHKCAKRNSIKAKYATTIYEHFERGIYYECVRADLISVFVFVCKKSLRTTCQLTGKYQISFYTLSHLFWCFFVVCVLWAFFVSFSNSSLFSLILMDLHCFCEFFCVFFACFCLNVIC